MDYVKALSFITDDPRWKEKLAIGTGIVLISSMLSVILIGIVGFFIVFGYCIRLLQNLRDGSPTPLPEWDRWSEDLAVGFKYAVVALVWSIPVFLLMLPTIFGGLLTGVDNSVMNTVGALLILAGYCLVILYAIALTLLSPGFTIFFARDEHINSGLQFTAIWAWTRAHLGEVVLYTIAYLVASFLITSVASVVGMFLCFVGLIITVPLGTLVVYIYQFNLLGQIAYKDRTGLTYYQPAVAAPVAAAPAAQAPYMPPAAPPPAAPAPGAEPPAENSPQA